MHVWDRALAAAASFVLLLSLPPAAFAQSDPIAEGYTRLYLGEPEDAQAHFDRLRQRDQKALGPWFGSLFVTTARLDYDDRLAPALEESLDAFIDRAAQRYGRSAQDSEALFYLAQAYLLRGTYRLNFDKGMWGAARDAAKSKGYAETYVKRHPEHGDAYVALGLYNYYVDIAPTFVKVLRVLLFLPSGDRRTGIEQLERASRDGNMFAPFARTALAEIYGTFEGRLDVAIPMAERQVQHFPGNAEMRLELASMYLHPAIEEYQRAEQQYAAVRAAAAAGSTARHLSHQHSAILGLASVRRSQWRIAEALDLLTPAVETNPASPSWALPNLLLRRANYKMLLNDPSALADARRVRSDAGMKKWRKAAERQIAAIEDRRRGNQAAVYAALIRGNRLVAERRFDEARAEYAAIAARHPGDWQVRYRLAYLEFARRRYDAAIAALGPIVSAASPMPNWLKAGALLTLAWTYDLQGERAQAVELYTRIVDEFEDESPAGAARLGLIAPYRDTRAVAGLRGR